MSNLRWYIFRDSEIVANNAEIRYTRKNPDIRYTGCNELLLWRLNYFLHVCFDHKLYNKPRPYFVGKYYQRLLPFSTVSRVSRLAHNNRGRKQQPTTKPFFKATLYLVFKYSNFIYGKITFQLSCLFSDFFIFFLFMLILEFDITQHVKAI